MDNNRFDIEQTALEDMTVVKITTCNGEGRQDLYNLRLLVVILVVLTEREFSFSLLISQLMAKTMQVKDPNSKKPAF